MSIASEITRISGNVADAYTAANAKGATMPITQNSDNLATTIATIPTGTTPTGTKQITTNGTHDVAGYANADVQVPTTAPELYRVFRNNNGKLENSITTPFIPLPSSVTNVGQYVLYTWYKNTPSSVLAGVIDLSSLTTVSDMYALAEAFYGCSGITSVDLSSLVTVPGTNAFSKTFSGCSGITSIDLSSLTTVSGMSAFQEAFYGCSGLTSINFSNLTTISGSTAFANLAYGCSNLTSCKMNKLNVMSVQITASFWPMFPNCVVLESLELGGLIASTFASKKDQIAYLFDANTGSQAPNGCTIHFPSNFDPSDPNHTFDASTLAGYPTFGGSASYIHVAFDLPATES